MFRHNSTLNQFEGYNNGAWGAIGGGAGATGGGTDEVFFESDTKLLTTDYTVLLLEKMHILLALLLDSVGLLLLCLLVQFICYSLIMALNINGTTGISGVDGSAYLHLL